MPSLKASERQQKIVDQLNIHGRVDVLELAEELDVSGVTIRADLAYLERSQILRRIRGGAISARPSRYERPPEMNAVMHSAEKEAIAGLAASMIRDGETIIMDTGSTVTALASQIPHTLTDIAVVTNSLSVAAILSEHPGATVIVTGGTLRPKLNSLVSPFGELLLREINADVAFMSCAGVHAQKGFTNSNWQEAEIKKSMIQAAGKVVFLADHSKLKHVATAKIAALTEADMLITDNNASVEVVKEMRGLGLELIIA
ncbi:DeoR/GlpR family DNA-binding transcription regulator [Marinibacterium profundimaris]|uniref:HTH deoR-type domain-containing protein n=1 Tax=Marinibacterium profundimaris TaxID=1679460 RepID=A0A225NBS6_9RHOB|nr:DeoR/GlpR family DNA-binding transcription regulator [Marinibacterium profundimaris]OWU68354.1 hypothetical protein ATO3_24575 [Marinibacterium profundimaris]